MGNWACGINLGGSGHAGEKLPMTAQSTKKEPSQRLLSLDAYRGLIMLTLAGSGFGARAMAQKYPDSPFWQTMGFQMDHPPWESNFGAGVAYWDLIMPAFLFMVGLAMPYSYGRRSSEGHSSCRLFGHALWRSVVLVLLGVFLQSQRTAQTNWVFMNVLSQIGLGYWAVYLLLGRGLKIQLAACAAILIGDWLAFVLYPAPQPGLFAHWIKDANLGAACDRWFLNLFPRSEPFTSFSGGYTTINFIPSIVTMALGLMCGEMLRRPLSPLAKLLRLILAGAVCLLLGLAAGYTICPIIKRLWTPSWTLFSGGYVIGILAAFFLVVDVLGWKRWAFPLIVVGMNSILMYLMAQLLGPYTGQMLRTHLGTDLFSGSYGPVISASAVALAYWLICFWLYRQKVFLRI